MVEQLGEQSFGIPIIAAHELRLGRFLEYAEGALVVRFLPAVIRQQLPAQVEIFVGRLGGQGVQSLVAGMVVEVRQGIGRTGVQILFPPQIEVGDDGEQVFEFLQFGARRNCREQMVADLPVNLAPLLNRNG